jgi:hypothetical protein
VLGHSVLTFARKALSMAVSEYERTQLFNWFEEHMGRERATTMMNLLPPVGWGDVATRRDLEVLEERIDSRFALVEQRLDSMATRADLAESLRQLERTLVTWIFLAQATVVAAIGGLLAFLR